MKNHAYVLLAALATSCSKPDAEPALGTVAAALHEEKPSCKNGDDDLPAVVDVSAEGAPTRGPKDAPVEIVFWSDFECPFCEKAEATLKQVEAERPGKVKIAFRQRPLPMHEHAMLAAKASLAAERQGRFWPYHDALLQHQSALERADLVRYATDIGLDHFRFEHDLDDPALDAKVAEEVKRATFLQVRGTPTAFINGRRLTGAQPIEAWLGLVDAKN